MLRLASLALCAALTAGAASADPRDYRDDGYERGHPRAPGGWERGYEYEYGHPGGPRYGAGSRYEHRAEYDSRDDRREGYGDRYGPSHDDYDRYAFRPRPVGYSLPTYGDAAQFYGIPCASACGGRRPAPCARGCGELALPSSFFYDYGGVGPIPDGGYYGGGGFGYAYAGAGASASASASAYASSRASVRIGGGHKGGKPCCHGGKGGK